MIALSVAKLKFFSPESEIALGLKQKKNVFVESLDQFRSLEVRERVGNAFVMSLRLSDGKVLHNIASFCDFARNFSLSSIVFRTNFWGLRNLIKQLFHSRLLDERLVIAIRTSLAIYHLIALHALHVRFTLWYVSSPSSS